MKKGLLLGFILCFQFSVLRAGGPGGDVEDVQMTASTKAESGESGKLSLKILPAFFWSTIGLEGEYTLSSKLSVGVNLLGTLGRLDGKNANYKTRPQSYAEEGYRAELALKYYLKGNAPEGLYLQFNSAYSELFYADGNTRPYTLYNRWKKGSGLRQPNNFEKPNPLSAGLGAGYQFVIIPEHVILNATAVVQVHQDSEGIFMQLYIAPSIGWMF